MMVSTPSSLIRGLEFEPRYEITFVRKILSPKQLPARIQIRCNAQMRLLNIKCLHGLSLFWNDILFLSFKLMVFKFVLVHSMKIYGPKYLYGWPNFTRHKLENFYVGIELCLLQLTCGLRNWTYADRN